MQSKNGHAKQNKRKPERQSQKKEKINSMWLLCALFDLILST